MGVGKDLWNQFEALYSKKDFDGLASLFASDAVHVDPMGRREGRKAIRAFFEAGDKALSDIRFEASVVIEEGDIVVAEWTWRGAFTGPLTMPDGTEIPATGKTLEHPGATISDVRDGTFATMRDYYDNTPWMMAFGLMPGT